MPFFGLFIFNNYPPPLNLVFGAMVKGRVVRVQELIGVILLRSRARQFTLTVHLFTQLERRVPENCWTNLTECWVVTCDGLASHPGGGAILAASCYRNQS